MSVLKEVKINHFELRLDKKPEDYDGDYKQAIAFWGPTNNKTATNAIIGKWGSNFH